MSAENEFDWVASTVLPPLSSVPSSTFWANAYGMSAGTAEAVAITEIAAIVVFRNNIVRVDQGIIYLRFGAE
jgi:hypothetical protein